MVITLHIGGARHVGVILVPPQYHAYLGGSWRNISHPEGGSPSPCDLGSYLGPLGAVSPSYELPYCDGPSQSSPCIMLAV